MVKILTAGHERDDLENGFYDTDEAVFKIIFIFYAVLKEPRPGRNQAEVSGLGLRWLHSVRASLGKRKAPLWSQSLV